MHASLARPESGNFGEILPLVPEGVIIPLFTVR
jgi:hypothetical protein